MTVQVITPENREAWLSARSQDVTASVAGALFGVHPYITAYQLWAEKTGALKRDASESLAMRRGRLLEPVAVEMLREDRPDLAVTYLQDNAYYRDPALRVGATPDAFLDLKSSFLDIRHPYKSGICQFKTSSEEAFRRYWLDPDTGDVEVPTWIAVQAIVEAKLTSASFACVAVMVVGRGIEMHVFDIPILEDVWQSLTTKVTEFWSIVDSGGHPPVDWDRDASTVIDLHRSTTSKRIDLTNDPGVDVLVGKFEDCRLTRRESEKLEGILRAQITYALGDADEAETSRYKIIAPEIVRTNGTSYRTIRVKPKEGNFNEY